MKRNGVTRPAEVPLADIRRKIKSYHALLKDGKVQDLNEDEMAKFREETNKYYGDLNDEERKMANEVKSSYKPDFPFGIQ